VKETIGKLLGELQAIYSNEEIIVCFIEDLAKLGNAEVQKLMSWYRLTVTKGPSFPEQYARVQERMKILAENDTKNAKETPVGQTTPENK